MLMNRNMVGLGSTPATAPGFVDGLKAWTNPVTALTNLKSKVTGGDALGDGLQYTAGLALPLAAVAAMLLSRGGRRR